MNISHTGPPEITLKTNMHAILQHVQYGKDIKRFRQAGSLAALPQLSQVMTRQALTE
jgi:hypothetical protein